MIDTLEINYSIKSDTLTKNVYSKDYYKLKTVIPNKSKVLVFVFKYFINFLVELWVDFGIVNQPDWLAYLVNLYADRLYVSVLEDKSSIKLIVTIQYEDLNRNFDSLTLLDFVIFKCFNIIYLKLLRGQFKNYNKSCVRTKEPSLHRPKYSFAGGYRFFITSN